MALPKTLLQLAGVELAPPATRGSALVLIDAQRFYAAGALALPGIDRALRALSAALARARAAGVPVLHVVHHGKPGTLFDPAGEPAAVLPEAAPLASEQVIVKRMPSAFTATQLESSLRALEVTTPVFAGFMTHMCVSSAVRAAAELGFQPWVVADACAARSLPDGRGGVLDAETVHRAHLASLADRFAGILESGALWGSLAGDDPPL
jgi:nicotinamidase-related amidase